MVKVNSARPCVNLGLCCERSRRDTNGFAPVGPDWKIHPPLHEISRARMLIWPWKSGPSAAVPPNHRVYAIGDIHGQAALLDDLLGMIERDGMGRPENNVLVFIGDYVDRGADSKAVIEQLLNLQSDFTAHFLRGNHDQALLDFLADP